MLCFGGVGQSVGADGMIDERPRPRSCGWSDARGKVTYAFFAQLNMIADVIKVLCICGWCYRSQTRNPAAYIHLPFLEGLIGDAQPPANLKL
jgi:hypothetical protein